MQGVRNCGLEGCKVAKILRPSSLNDSDGGVTRSRYMSIKQESCEIIWTNAE